MQINDRLRFIRKSLKKTQEEFAFLFNITQAGYSRIERGEIELTSDKIQYLSEYDININWLINGTGEPFTTDSSKINNSISDNKESAPKAEENSTVPYYLYAELKEENGQLREEIGRLKEIIAQKGGESSNQTSHDKSTHSKSAG